MVRSIEPGERSKCVGKIIDKTTTHLFTAQLRLSISNVGFDVISHLSVAAANC